ncbi:MAG: nuclear transport factor 2 family protein [Deltaproteobacteria bacterium]|nr:nuclear transport factor 2 family protein [Deltaproteobacteria bacterium]MBI3386187.1 nuclear transport factor 2 family protein [Deltaproteobacteria bacterium]
MELWQLSAREGIRDTLARYAHCADSGRFAELVELFTEDGVLEIDGRAPLAGRAAILTFLTSTKTSLATGETQPFIRHHLSSIRIDIANTDTASAASYFLAITHRGPDHWGRYRDQLVQVGERWLFRHRRVRVDGRAPQGWSATRTDSL